MSVVTLALSSLANPSPRHENWEWDQKMYIYRIQAQSHTKNCVRIVKKWISIKHSPNEKHFWEIVVFQESPKFLKTIVPMANDVKIGPSSWGSTWYPEWYPAGVGMASKCTNWEEICTSDLFCPHTAGQDA